MNIQKNNVNRRAFLQNLTKLALANTGVYLVGSAISAQHGKLSAGAKTWQYYYTYNPCNLPGPGVPSPYCVDYPFPTCPTLNEYCFNLCTFDLMSGINYNAVYKCLP